MATRGILANGPGIGLQATQWDTAYGPPPSSSMWQGAPNPYNLDPLGAYEFYEDFIGVSLSASTWIATQATTGTAAAGVIAGGTVALNAGAATVHQGEQLQRAGTHFIPTLNKAMWFECRLQTTVIAMEFFCGLADIDTTIIATGAMHATDFIGFKSLTNNGVILPTVSSASTPTSGATTNTLGASTMVRLGFIVTSNTSVQFYVNGIATGTPITTNIPSVALSPSFVCQAGGVGTPQVDVDYVGVIQLR